jgi:carbon storage regulator CsrA
MLTWRIKMLMLTRKDGESIVIAPGTPHECRITVWIRTERDGARKVRLGFEAARSVEILRTEIMGTEAGDDRNDS